MLVKVDGLHDESNWPQTIGPTETDERRRLYWSMYTLEIFAAACFGSAIASRQVHTRVEFPQEIGDYDLVDALSSTQIDDRGPKHSSNNPTSSTHLGYSVR